MRITFLKHASFLLDGELKIYIDPYNLVGNLPEADMVLITHSHFDHCSPDDVSKVGSQKTVILAPPDCSIPFDFKSVKPGDVIRNNNIVVTTVPAYNIGKNFHPKDKNWVGYIIQMNGIKIYHAGDTDVIDEMAGIETDIALLPVGGTYTMDSAEAIEAVKKINPKLAIPMHYGEVVGSTNDAINFCRRCPVECKVMKPYESWEVDIK